MSPARRPEIRFSAYVSKPQTLELVDRRLAPLKDDEGRRYDYQSPDFSTPNGLPLRFKVRLEGAVWVDVTSGSASIFKIEIIEPYASIDLWLPTDEWLHISITSR
jgi:hypothetical protein